MLLVGAEGLALRGMVEKLLPEGMGAEAVDGAESILEAVLMSGGGGRSGNVPVIMAGISQELEQIEPAVRSMRKVYPRSRIVLLCEPGDEVLCRKAKGWGATDYVILPADTAVLRRLLAAGMLLEKPEKPEKNSPEPAAQKHAANGQAAHGSQERPAAMTPARLLQKVIEVPAGTSHDHLVASVDTQVPDAPAMVVSEGA